MLATKASNSGSWSEVDWSAPRLVCIAGDFTRYDEHAVTQISRNIELYRYRSYEGLFLLELVNKPSVGISTNSSAGPPAQTGSKLPSQAKTVSQFLDQAPATLKELYDDLDRVLMAFGEDVTVKTNKNYFAYRRIKNFACVEVHPAAGALVAYVKVDPATVPLEAGFTADVRDLGHFGTGDLKVTIKDAETLERARPLLRSSYEAS